MSYEIGPNIGDQIMKQALHAITEMEEGLDLSSEERTVLLHVLLATAQNMKGEGNRTRFIKDYSGRCMQGAACIAITCDKPDEFAFALAQACFDANLNPKEIRELLGTAAEDSLGRQTVMYWPRLLTRKPRAWEAS